MKKEKSEFSKTMDRMVAAQSLIGAAPDVCPALAKAKEFFYEQIGLSGFVLSSSALAKSEGSKMEFSEDVVLLSKGAFNMAVRLSYVLAVALSSGNVQAVEQAIEKYKSGKEEMLCKLNELNASY